MIIQNSLQYIAIAVKGTGRLSMYKEQLEVTAVDTDSAQWKNTDR